MNEKEPLIAEESPKRRRKILTDPERMFAKCKNCFEPGNLDNMIRVQLPVKNLVGVELYGAFNFVYFCSDNCQGLFN